MDWLTTMRDNKELTKYISTFVLGDGSISIDKRDNGNAVFECSHIEDHLDYLEWKKSILENITTVKLTKIHDIEERDFNNGFKSITKPLYRIRTARHPFFNNFRRRLYLEGKRVIDPHYLKLMDWESLAILYMDDGYISSYLSKGKYPYNKVGLCTLRYSYGDNLMLKKFLKEKLNLEFNITQQTYKSGLKYRLLLRAKDIPYFIDNISKYILPSYEYKLHQSRTGIST